MPDEFEFEDLSEPVDVIEDIDERGPDLTDLPDEMPHIVDVKPTGYHLLIEIPERSDQTAGGIVRPDDYRLREQVASVIALVVEVGPEAFRDKDRFPTQKAWCQAGDYILIHPYTGSRFQIRDSVTRRFIEYRILEDRHVLAVVSKRAIQAVDRINAA
jgi:co-chaperonin GroES (HSP10)